jgi:hypothetical protein
MGWMKIPGESVHREDGIFFHELVGEAMRPGNGLKTVRLQKGPRKSSGTVIR